MASYVISYDLHNHRDYTNLINSLSRVGAVRILASMWLWDVNDTAAGVRNALAELTDADDSIVVIELAKRSNWATINAPELANNWLQLYLTG